MDQELTDSQKQQLQAEIQRMQNTYQLQQELGNYTEMCWDLCISKPGTKLSDRESNCVSNCFERFLDTAIFVRNHLAHKRVYAMPSVTVLSRKGKNVGEFDVANVSELTKEVARAVRLNPNRVRITVQDDKGKRIVLKDEALAGLTDDDVVEYKDMGPQVAWRTVFLVEYGGPFVIHALFYFYPHLIYPLFGVTTASPSNVYDLTDVRFLAFVLAFFHYGKRLVETVFVHRFSNGTMPIMNIFKNSFHYWILGGVFIAYNIHHPDYTAPTNANLITAMAVAFMFCELNNGWTHLQLRWLRPAHDLKRRAIPRGFWFNFMSCPNYFFESMAWLTYSVLVNSLASWIFFLAGFLQMCQWANGKHRRYKKEFSDYPKGRSRIVPFIY